MKGNVAVVVRRASEGDRAAWEMLVTEYSGLLWAVDPALPARRAQRADACRRPGSRLFEHLDDIREPERLRGGCATTVRRACLESLRGSKREEPVESLHEQPGRSVPATPSPTTACPVRSALRREHQALVRRVLADLPEQAPSADGPAAGGSGPELREVSAQLGMPVGQHRPDPGPDPGPDAGDARGVRPERPGAVMNTRSQSFGSPIAMPTMPTTTGATTAWAVCHCGQALDVWAGRHCTRCGTRIARPGSPA